MQNFQTIHENFMLTCGVVVAITDQNTFEWNLSLEFCRDAGLMY